MRHTIQSRARSGFTILEVLLALAIFTSMAVGVTTALNMVAVGSVRSGEEVRMIRNLETLLTEASKAAQFEEGTLYLGAENQGTADEVNYERIIEELEMENMDGQQLQQMWRIAIVASYQRNGELVERVAETFRYEPLYQANR